MAANIDHNKLIRRSAQRALEPLGVQQRGRSRTWLDDHGWWLIVVEFQPSSWARGTYLNVGAMWLWQRIDHFAFEFGNRVCDFLDVAALADPTAALDRVADKAAAEVQRIRRILTSPHAMAHALADKPHGGEWDLLHAATAALVADEPAFAQQLLGRRKPPPTDAPSWYHELWREGNELQRSVTGRDELKTRLRSMVTTSRSALRLPEWRGSIPFTSTT